MACGTLTKGRGLDCNRTAGGIKAIFFGVYDQFDDPISTTGIVQSAGEITDIEMSGNDLYRYILPLGTATVSESYFWLYGKWQPLFCSFCNYYA
jgi:hypothetical protein